MIIDTLTWNYKNMIEKVSKQNKKWQNFSIILLLYMFFGSISGLLNKSIAPDMSRKTAIIVGAGGALVAFMISIFAIFIFFMIFKIVLHLNIERQQIFYLGILGTVPLLFATIFTIICTTVMGVSKYGYTSANFFLHTKSGILNSLYTAINPFSIWSILLVSIIFVNLTSKNKKWLIIVYFIIWEVVNVFIG